MAMTQEQLDGHFNHLRGVIRLAHKDGRHAYGSLLEALAVVFQAVAPENAEVKAFAKRLTKEAQTFEMDLTENAEQKQQRTGGGDRPAAPTAGQARAQATGDQTGKPAPDRAVGQQQSR